MVNIDPEELQIFLQEAEEQLQLLDEQIIRLEKDADNPDVIQDIFRAAHTLKGSSGMLGLQKIAGLTHVMEDTLDKVRSGTLAVTADLVDSLLQCLDALKALVESAASGEEGAVDIDPLIAILREAAGAGGATETVSEDRPSVSASAAADPAVVERLEAALADGDRAYVVGIGIVPGTDWAAVRCLQAMNELSSLGRVIHSVPSSEEIEEEKVGSRLEILLATSEGPEAIRNAVLAVEDIDAVAVDDWSAAAPEATADERDNDQGSAADGDEKRVIDLGPVARGKEPAEQLEMAAQKVETMQTVRIDIDRLDVLMNLVGELIIDRTRITQISKSLQIQHKDEDLVDALAQTCTHIEKVVGELNEGMMGVRMLPVGTLFNRFPRLIRDAARATGKNVELVTEGEGTEIDRAVIEKIKDPLMHLLRNAVDHGIESPEVREQAGKPTSSVVKLAARHEQGHILITLEDDGKGIDPQVMKAAAVQKGVISAEAASRLSDAEAIELVFEAGFSTAAKTTDLSGRGVGMDVVRTSIADLNGLVKIDSVVGAGTTVTLQLPLTLATFRGLLVESGNALYAFPLSYVQETGALDSASIEMIVDSEVVRLRGEVLPLLRLNTICQSDSSNGRQEGEGFFVTVKAGERPVAIAVDALRQQQEIVVKSLGDYIGQTEGIAGASILGDGQVVLILDVASLVRAATKGNRSTPKLERRAS